RIEKSIRCSAKRSAYSDSPSEASHSLTERIALGVPLREVVYASGVGIRDQALQAHLQVIRCWAIRSLASPPAARALRASAMNLRRPHRTYPKAKDLSRSIPDYGPCMQQRRPAHVRFGS